MCCSFQMLMRKNTTTVLNRLFLLGGPRSNTLITTVLPFLASVMLLQLWLTLSAMEVGALCVMRGGGVGGMFQHSVIVPTH